jgi:hypothetical protein
MALAPVKGMEENTEVGPSLGVAVLVSLADHGPQADNRR